MKRIASVIFAMTLLVTASYVSSCKKKNGQDATPNDGVTSESNEAQSQWDDVLKISEDAITAEGEAITRTTASPGITKETISEGNFIGKITVDFGAATLGDDGRTRSGKIIIKYTGKYRTSGTVIQSTTENYFVNGKEIRGVRTVTNNGSNVYLVVDAGLAGEEFAQIIYTDGKFTKWKSTRHRTWTGGSSTLTTLLDDVYSVTGDASGVSREGTAYTMTITNVIVKLDCFITYYIYMPSGGQIDIEAGGKTRSINYGNGSSCDRDVIYTINGKSYELSL